MSRPQPVLNLSIFRLPGDRLGLPDDHPDPDGVWTLRGKREAVWEVGRFRVGGMPRPGDAPVMHQRCNRVYGLKT